MHSKHTLGIVVEKKHNNYTLTLPLVSVVWQPTVAYHEAPLYVGDRVLCHMSEPYADPVVMRRYGSVNDRSIDTYVVTDLLGHVQTLDLAGLPGPMQTAATHFTQPYANLSHLDTYTIDPASTVDFDDAISVDADARTFYVHIADAHHGLSLGSSEDRAALAKATTLYLPDHTDHMMADKMPFLSLVEGVHRRAITVKVVLAADLKVASYDIFESLIVVKKRYTYEQANLTEPPGFALLKAFAATWHVNKLTIPAVRLHTAHGHVTHTTLEYGDDVAHHVVACLMVTANVLIAKHMNVPQRFHEKLASVEPPPVCDHPVVNSYRVVRKYAKARYDLCAGHFGLNLPVYTHFTSPIRRYFDVLVHRMLAGVVYPPELMDRMLDHINHVSAYAKELAALHHRWKLLDYVSKFQNTWYDAYVTKVSPRGAYVLIPELMLDGFLEGSDVLAEGTHVRVRILRVCMIEGRVMEMEHLRT
jgi:ribonuclease R